MVCDQSYFALISLRIVHWISGNKIKVISLKRILNNSLNLLIKVVRGLEMS